MVFLNTQMMGLHFAFPDVCLTPVPAPTPIPYPNIGLPMMALLFTFKIFMMCMPTHQLLTTVPMSNGDNAGVSMGVASGMVMGPVRHILGSFMLFHICMPVTMFLSLTGNNGLSPNMIGATIVPSQPKWLVMR